MSIPERWKDATGRIVPGPDDRSDHERKIVTHRPAARGTVTGPRVLSRRVCLQVQAILDGAARRMLDEEQGS
jgi:hypothetical protein